MEGSITAHMVVEGAGARAGALWASALNTAAVSSAWRTALSRSGRLVERQL